MATKKTTNAVEKMDAVTPVVDKVETKDEPVFTEATTTGVVPYVESSLWTVVEDATMIKTLVMNMPTGAMIMTVSDGKHTMQYVAGIHYDVTTKRFSV